MTLLQADIGAFPDQGVAPATPDLGSFMPLIVTLLAVAGIVILFFALLFILRAVLRRRARDRTRNGIRDRKPLSPN